MDIIIYIIGFVIFVKLITIGATVKNLLNIRFKYGGCELCDTDDVPLYLQGLFRDCEDELSQAGFVFSHCQFIDEPFCTSYSLKWNIVYYHTDKKCYATISESFLADSYNPVNVEFASVFDNGQKLVTINGLLYAVIGEIPGVRFNDPYAPDLEKQLQSHLSTLAAIKHTRALVALTPDEFVELERKNNHDYVDYLISNDFIKQTKEDNYCLRFIPAIRQASKMAIGAGKVRRMHDEVKKIAKTQNTSPVPVEVEVKSYMKMQQMLEPQKKKNFVKVLVLVASILLFMFSFKIIFSAHIVFLLVAALFLHELGHYFGMYLFKYKDVRILFIPFLGAATLGEETTATTIQKVIVYLMGPAPGLILGTCLLFFYRSAPPIVREFAIMLLVLNYLNLLPILPLDGGRIFEVAIFSRFKFLKFVFIIFSIVIMVLSASYINDPILYVLPAILFVSLIFQVRQGNILSILNKKIKNDNIVRAKENLLPLIFDSLKNSSFRNVQFQKKVPIVKNILAELTKKPPVFTEALLSLFLYIFVFLTPAFIALGVGISSGIDYLNTFSGQGVVSFHPSPDSERILVTRIVSPFKYNACVLDKHGKMVMDIGKEFQYVSENLFWLPNKGSKYIFYEQANKKALLGLDQGATGRNPAFLVNIETEEKQLIPKPSSTSDKDFITYCQWDKTGQWLLGTKYNSSDDNYQLTSVFKQNIETKETHEFKVKPSDANKISQPVFIDENRVFVELYDSSQPEHLGYAVLNFSSGEKETHVLPDVIQLEFSSEKNKIYILRKIFSENMVKHEIVERDIETNNEKITASPELPQCSFEDVARGKAPEIYFELSPRCRWMACDSWGDNTKKVKYLINLENSSHYLLTECDKDTYAGRVIYSQDETKLGLLISGRNDEANDRQWMNIYDINGPEPQMLQEIDLKNNWGQYGFLGNERILYVNDNGESSENTKNELCYLDITSGKHYRLSE
ncbi:MAG: site-2 protease family protein [Sedimentisphaerales bacterium]|nr:site-2 protease family protein [Sedimentisphaerales bacterium]